MYWILFGLVFGFKQIDLIQVQYDLDICGDKSVLFFKAFEQVTGFTVLSNGSISWFTSTYFCTSKHNNSIHIKDGDADGGCCCCCCFFYVCWAKRFVPFYFVLLLLALDLFHTNDKNSSRFYMHMILVNSILPLSYLKEYSTTNTIASHTDIEFSEKFSQTINAYPAYRNPTPLSIAHITYKIVRRFKHF